MESRRLIRQEAERYWEISEYYKKVPMRIRRNQRYLEEIQQRVEDMVLSKENQRGSTGRFLRRTYQNITVLLNPERAPKQKVLTIKERELMDSLQEGLAERAPRENERDLLILMERVGVQGAVSYIIGDL